MKKKLVITAVVLVVFWFTGGAWICQIVGKSLLRDGLLPVERAASWTIADLADHPPTDELYTGYRLVRLSAMSPFFSDTTLVIRLSRLAVPAAMMSSAIRENMPLDYGSGNREAWEEVINWLDDNREDIDELLVRVNLRLDDFDEPMESHIIDMATLGHGGVLALRDFQVGSFQYVEVLGEDGQQRWSAPVDFLGQDGLTNRLAVAPNYLFLRGFDPENREPTTEMFSLNDGEHSFRLFPTDRVRPYLDPLFSGAAIAATDEHLVQLSAESINEFNITAIDLGSGRVAWQTSLPSSTYSPRIISLNQEFLVVDGFPSTVMLSMADGQLTTVDDRDRCSLVDQQLFCTGNGFGIRQISLPNLVPTNIELLTHFEELNCHPNTTGIGGEYEGAVVLAIDCDGMGLFKSLLLFLDPQTSTYIGHMDLEPYFAPDDFLSDFARYFPAHSVLSGELPRYVPLRVRHREETWHVIIVDLQERAVVWESLPQPDLLFWDLFYANGLHFITRGNSLLVWDSQSARFSAAIRIGEGSSVYEFQPYHLTSDGLIVFGDHEWVVLDPTTLIPPSSDTELSIEPILDELAAYFGFTAGRALIPE